MGSRSHSNLFDKKGWGWGTRADAQAAAKGKVFWNPRSDSVRVRVRVHAGYCTSDPKKKRKEKLVAFTDHWRSSIRFESRC